MKHFPLFARAAQTMLAGRRETAYNKAKNGEKRNFMSDIFPTEAIAALFSLTDSAVIGTQNQRIAFLNPAARRALACDDVGRPASCLFPAHVLQSQAREFVTSAEIRGRRALLAVTTLGTFRLYTLHFEAKPELVNPIFVPQLDTLASFRLVADYFSHYAETADDPKLTRYSAELMRFYYQFHRWIRNASTLSALHDGTLPFQPTPVDCVAFLESVLTDVRYFAEIHGITLESDLPEGALLCEFDAGLIEQMLMNILVNSLLHCDKGDRVHVTLSSGKDRIYFTVYDTGSGIPPHKLATVFRSYAVQSLSPAEAGGAGFGLAVALGIAEKHGGTILVESSEGAGTSVRVLLEKKLPEGDAFKCMPPVYQARQNTALFSGLADFLDVKAFQSGAVE